MEFGPIFRLMWLLFGAMAVAIFSMISRVAHAYVPKARVVLEKVGHQHGKGSYFVQDEVTLRDEKGQITILEDWVIDNAGAMSLAARGSGQQINYIYKGRQKFYLDDRGTEHEEVVSSDFFEPVFYARTWETLADFLARERILPSKNLPRETITKETKKEHGKEAKDFQYTPDSFVRLSRTAGVVTLALGKPTPADSSKALPGFWVEQDRFLIRRFRLESQAEVSADDYSDYAHGLWFPKSRTVSWGDRAVNIRVVKIAAITEATAKARANPAALKKTAGENLSNPTVAEFYKRFR